VEIVAAKKIGAESSDPNRYSQPRLPGSVVGDASMRQVRLTRQDYEGHCPKVIELQAKS